MGVDCRIYLPGNVRIVDVSRVIGKLIGLRVIRTLEKQHPPGFVDVVGLSLEHLPNTLFECVRINYENIEGVAEKVYGEKATYLYQYESDHGSDRVILARSCAFNIAVFKGLADFFGGSLDYNDLLDLPKYGVPYKNDELNQPEDGNPYWDLQDRIFNLPALTTKDFVAAAVHSHYDM